MGLSKWHKTAGFLLPDARMGRHGDCDSTGLLTDAHHPCNMTFYMYQHYTSSHEVTTAA